MKGCKRCAGGGTKKGRLSDTGLVTQQKVLQDLLVRRMWLLKNINGIYKAHPDLKPVKNGDKPKAVSCPDGYNKCTLLNKTFKNGNKKRVMTYAYKEPPAPRIPAEQKIRVPKGAMSITNKNTKSAEPLVQENNWGTKKEGKLTHKQLEIMLNR